MKWKPPTAVSAIKSEDLNSLCHASNFPVFAPIVSDAFDHFKGLPEETEIKSGSLVIEQSTQPCSVLLLRRGLVKLVYAAPDGRETMLGLRSAGWYAGAVPVLMRTPSFYSVKAVTPCVLSRIPAEEFPGRLMQSARMLRHFMETLCHELTSQAIEVRVMGEPAEQRLAQFMYERTTQHSQIKTLDTLPLLKQMELAQLLAITPEHLSRLLHKADATHAVAEAATNPATGPLPSVAGVALPDAIGGQRFKG